MLRANYSLVSASYVLSLAILAGCSCKEPHLSPTQIGNWLESAEIRGVPRSNAVSFTIGDIAYVGTGYNSTVSPGRINDRLNDFWSFNTDSGWKQVQSLPAPPRSNAVAFGLGSFGYVGTGYDGVKMYNDFYQYDPSLNQWTIKNTFPGEARYDAVGFAVKGNGYIGTGYNGNWLNDFYQYDPQQDKWVLTIGTSGDLSKRRGATVFVYHDKAYLLGGSRDASMTKDFWSFDPTQPAPWLRLGDLINDNTSTKDDGYTDIQREYAVTFVNGDSAYLTLGENIQPLATTWVYDFVHDQWARRTAYHRQVRVGAVAFTIKGRSFVGTGGPGPNSTMTYDDFDEFLPNQPYNANN